MQFGLSNGGNLKRTHALVAFLAALFAIIALTKSIHAAPPPGDICDDLFDLRTDLDKAKEALTCYEDALALPETTPANTRRLQEGAFRTVAWLYTNLSSDMDKLLFVNRGLRMTNSIIQKNPQNAIGYFWDAVLTSLNCQILDKGKVIPSCILSAKKEVISYLENTRKLELPLEGAGGSRILGIFLTKLPKLVGGDKKRGEELLTEALTQAPDYSSNFLELGRFLVDQKRETEATNVLNSFLSLNCVAMDPKRSLECEVDQQEAKRLLGL